jgi:hypothetical protein
VNREAKRVLWGRASLLEIIALLESMMGVASMKIRNE